MDQDMRIRWIHDLVDRASGRSKVVTREIVESVSKADAALKESLATQVKVSSEVVKATQRQGLAWRQLTAVAGKADREIGAAELAKAASADEATVKMVAAARAQGSTYKQIALEARKAGASQEATASAIVAAAAREREAVTRTATAYKASADVAARADATLGIAEREKAAAVDAATLKIVQAARKQGVSYSAIATSAIGSSAKAAGAIEAAAAREKAAMDSVAATAKRTSEETRAAREKASGAASSVRGAVKTGVGLLGLGAAFEIGSKLRDATEYEATMSRVRANTGASADQLSRMDKMSKSLGSSLGIGARESADGLYELSRAGFHSDQVIGALPPTMKLARVGMLDLTEAAHAMHDAALPFQMDAKGISHVADVMSIAMHRSKASINDMGVSLSYVSSIAHHSGQTFDTTMAAITQLGRGGLVNQRAGTGLRRILTNLTSPNAKVQGALDDLGLGSNDLYSKDSSGRYAHLKQLPDVLQAIQTRLKGLGGVQQQTIIHTLFGQTGMEAGQILLSGPRNGRPGGLQGLRESIAEYRNASNGAGAATKMTGEIMDNVKGSVDKFGASIQNSAVSLLQRFQPAIRKVVNDAGTEIPKLAKGAGDFLEGAFGKRGGNGFDFPTSDAQKFGVEIHDIATQALGVAKEFRAIGVDVVHFIDHHGELKSIVSTLVVAGVAAKGIRFASQLSGLSLLLSRAQQLKQVLATTKVAKVATTAESTIANDIIAAKGAKPGSGLILPAGVRSVDTTALQGGEQVAAGAAAGAGFRAGARRFAGGVLTRVTGGGGLVRFAATRALPVALGYDVVKQAATGSSPVRSFANSKGQYDGQALPTTGGGTKSMLRDLEHWSFEQPAAETAARKFGDTLQKLGPKLGHLDSSKLIELGDSARKLGADFEPSRKALDAFANDVDRKLKSRFQDAIKSLKNGPRYQDDNSFLSGVEKQWEQLPEKAKGAGARSILQLSQSMERQGRLPRGSTDRLISYLEGRWDGLAHYLAQKGGDSSKGLAKGLSDDRIARGVQKQIDQVEKTWGNAPKMAKTTAGNARQNWSTEMAFLQRTIKSSTGQQKKDAQDAWSALAHTKLPHDARNSWDNAMDYLSKKIRTSTGGQRDAAIAAWAALATDSAAIAGATKQSFAQMAIDIGKSLDGLVRTMGIDMPRVAGIANTALASITGINISDLIAGLPGLTPSPRPSRPARRGRGRRAGGIIGFQEGGMVPAYVSPGEDILYGGMRWTVPGARTAADSVFAHLPIGATVLTDHGKSMYDAGAPIDYVIGNQAPHFRVGGPVQRFGTGGTAGDVKKSVGWTRIGATAYDDPPPGAFGSLSHGFAELGTATSSRSAHPGAATGFGWLARKWGLPGELPPHAAVDFARGNNVVTLTKADRGYGQGGPGTTADRSNPGYQADIWKDSWSKLGINGSWKGQLLARPHKGSVAGLTSFSYTRPAAVLHPRLVELEQPYGALDAFQQGFDFGSNADSVGGLFKGPNGLDTDLFKAAISGVKPNARDLPQKVTVRGTGATIGAKAAGLTGATSRQASIVGNVIASASSIIGKPYGHAGGHGTWNASNYDCSGAVGYSLHGAGLLNSYVDTDALKGWGQPGKGKYLTVGVRGSGPGGHTMLRAGKRYLESGGGGKYGQHKVHWDPGWDGAFDTYRHWPGLRKGGVVGGKRAGMVPVNDFAVKRARLGVSASDPRLYEPRGMGDGGKVARFRLGGIATFRAGTPAVGSVGPTRVVVRNTPTAASKATTLISSISTAGTGASADVTKAMRTLGDLLDLTQNVTYARLAKLDASVRGEIKQLDKGGVTGVERIQIRRLRGTLTLFEGEMGRRVGAASLAAQKALDAVDTRSTRLSQREAIAGIDEASLEGLGAAQRTDLGSLSGLSRSVGHRGGLQDQLNAARDAHQPQVVKSLEAQMRAIQDASIGLVTGIATRSRTIAATKIQSAVDAITKQLDAASQIRTGVERGLQISGVDQSSSAGMFALRDADVQTQGALQRTLGVATGRGKATVHTGLYAQLDAATKAGNTELAQSIRDTIAQYTDQIAGLGASIVEETRNAAAAALEEARAKIEATAQAAVDAASFGSGMAQSKEQGFETQQHLAELNGGPRFDSQAAAQARSDMITSTIIPAAQAELEALQRQAQAETDARGADSAEARAAQLAAQDRTNEILNDQLTAQQAIRDAAQASADSLKQLGGGMTFSFQGQQFSDLVDAGVGA